MSLVKRFVNRFTRLRSHIVHVKYHFYALEACNGKVFLNIPKSLYTFVADPEKFLRKLVSLSLTYGRKKDNKKQKNQKTKKLKFQKSFQRSTIVFSNLFHFQGVRSYLRPLFQK